MKQPTTIKEEWLKILSKGMVTIPKEWRVELGIEEGNIVKARKVGSKVIIEPSQSSLTAPYRTYTDSEINEFLREDQIPEELSVKINKTLDS